MRQNRVVHLSSVHRADDTRVFYKECRSLAAAGYDVTLIARSGGADVADEVQVVPVRAKGQSRFGRMTTVVLDVFFKAMKAKGDVYHFHDAELIPVGLILRALRKHVIYDVHEDLEAQIQTKAWIPLRLRPPVGKIAGTVESVASKLFSGIVVANPLQDGRFPRQKTVAVQNFPMLEELADIPCNEYDDRKDQVLYVGGISWARGAKEMVKAIEIVNRYRAVELRLAGPLENPGMEKQLEQLAGWEYTTWLGRLDRAQVVSELSNAKIGLVVVHPEPNYLTNQPVKLFEYMLAGLPVVASRFPNYKPFLEHSRTGLMVDPMRPEEIAEAILRLLEDSGEARAMGERARNAVRSQYTWEQEAAKMVALYSSLIGTPQEIR